MFTSTEDFFAAAATHIATFDEFTNAIFAPEEVRYDHICYKCAREETFLSIRSMFEAESAFVYQSIISGRRIAYIKFRSPLPGRFGPIWFLELSEQKPDGSQAEGFDHIEVYPVAPFSYAEMVARLAAKHAVVHVARPHHTTDDVVLPGGFIFRACEEPLIEKITRSEMK